MEDVHNRSIGPIKDPSSFHLAFRASFAVVTVWVVDRMVGFGRMISDGHRSASLHDIRVDRDFHGHDIERKIIEALLTRAPKVRVAIETTEEAGVKTELLQKIGFQKKDATMALLPTEKIELSAPENSPWAFTPVQLDGPRIRIRTLQADDIDELAQALHEPGGWFATRMGIDTVAKIKDMLRGDLGSFQSHHNHPLIYHAKGNIAGFTRLMRVEPHRRTLEIGGTWVCPVWRRSFVNTEVKKLLLKYCFEKLGANRVEFRVDVDNVTSQKSLSRLGAALEGTLRQRRGDGTDSSADGMVYSIIRAEWPSLELRLNSAFPEGPMRSP